MIVNIAIFGQSRVLPTSTEQSG